MRKTVLIVVAGLMATPAMAKDVTFEAGYTTLAVDDSGSSVDLGALYGLVGYEIARRGRYTHGVEGIVLLGIADDSLGAVTLDLKTSVEAAYRGTFSTSTPDLDLFWRATYTRIDIEANTAFGASVNDDDSGPGLGIGANYGRFAIGYTQYFGNLDDFSRLNIGFRF